MKKLLAIILTLVLFVSLAPSEHVQAAEMIDPETGFRYEEIDPEYEVDPNFDYEKTVIYYVDCEEDISSIEIDHESNIRYIFEWETPARTRAVCYNCGKSTMSTVTRKDQWGSDDKTCPLLGGPGLYNDLFNTWYYLSRERCTSCGYNSSEWDTGSRTYTSWCGNEHNPAIGEWEVRAEYSIDDGYDVHQILSWWTDKVLH